MSGEEGLLSLAAEGRDILLRERALLTGGDFDGLAPLAAEKQRLLQALEAAIPESGAGRGARAALEALIAEARRNEQLILAARQGVAVARRRIRQIADAADGAVAYGRDGTLIASNADRIRKSSRV